jgi:undecaprenyl-diphosphatase
VIAAGFLLVTAVLLVIGERMLSGDKEVSQLTWVDALVVGLFQTFALFPGISRSGSTIVGGLLRGLDRPEAARLSFLIGIPAIAGAGLFRLWIFSRRRRPYTPAVYITAFLAAALSGYACIHLLLTWVKRRGLTIFAVYCALFGLSSCCEPCWVNRSALRNCIRNRPALFMENPPVLSRVLTAALPEALVHITIKSHPSPS